MKNEQRKRGVVSESFVMGVIALVFLIIGYQTALFVHNAAVTVIAANRDEPDTVYVSRHICSENGKVEEMEVRERHEAYHPPRAESVRRNVPRRQTESFRFDPNTVSVDDLCRLGFSPRQAASIDNYRKKGGRFRRKEDFAKSFVVADSVYRRLEKYIDIPMLDLNVADSAAFDALPGIGGWFASRMVEYRERLGGYSYKEQLMDIHNFDRERYDGLSDLIMVSEDHIRPYPLWTLPADSLAAHPYINEYAARAIVLYRENNPKEMWSIEGLIKAGIFSAEDKKKISGCCIAAP